MHEAKVVIEECVNKHFPGMTMPEPSAFKVRTELRRLPTSKLRELCEAIGSGQMTGIEILDRNRGHAISACKEILWERGKLPEVSGETQKRVRNEISKGR